MSNPKYLTVRLGELHGGRSQRKQIWQSRRPHHSACLTLQLPKKDVGSFSESFSDPAGQLQACRSGRDQGTGCPCEVPAGRKWRSRCTHHLLRRVLLLPFFWIVIRYHTTFRAPRCCNVKKGPQKLQNTTKTQRLDILYDRWSMGHTFNNTTSL